MSRPIELFYIFFQGVVLFQAFIFGVIYFFTRKKDILFYGLFLGAVGIYFFINAPFTFFGIEEERVWNSTWYEYLNTPVVIVANIFYLLFHQAFFADLTYNPVVRKAFRSALVVMLLMIVLFAVLSRSYISSQLIYYISKTITIFPAAIVVYYLFRERPPFYKWIVIGLISVIIGTSLTAWFDYQFSEGIGSSIFATTYPFFFVKLGLLGEMIFYLAARLKKWNYQEKQLAVEKLASQLAVEKIRNKISAELHDDIGSTLSGISMYSHMAQNMVEAGKYDEIKNSVGVIQRSANELVHKLGDLIWTINPGKDSFEDMTEKLRQYGVEMCAAKEIDFRYRYQLEDPAKVISMDARQHVYLFIKEAINNAVKYSDAAIIELLIKATPNTLEIKIWDDGHGFDIHQITQGNGIANMKSRAKAVQGEMEIKSSVREGTTIKLLVKI